MSLIRREASSSTELAEAADANLVTHATWALERTPGMRVSRDLGVVLTDSGLPCDTFNLVCRARLTEGEAQAGIRAALAFYRAARRPFTWWVGPADQPANLGDLLISAGFAPAETEIAMAADLASLPAAPVPVGLEIRRARSATELHDFACVVAANWDPPDPEVLRFYALTAPALLEPDAPLGFYVGYLAGEPVASAELTLGGGVAGLYSICTLEAYRRQGIGTAMALQPLLDARASGVATAVLQAAVAGVGIYTRVGFAGFGGITEYKPS